MSRPGLYLPYSRLPGSFDESATKPHGDIDGGPDVWVVFLRKGASNLFDIVCQTWAANGIDCKLLQSPRHISRKSQVTSKYVRASVLLIRFKVCQPVTYSLLPDRRCWLVRIVGAKNISVRI